MKCGVEETLQRVKGERVILYTMKGRITGLSHTLRMSCLMKYGVKGKIEGRVEVRVRRRR